MQAQDLGLAGTGAQSSVQTNATPFMSGHRVLAIGQSVIAVTAMSVQVQTSPDDSTWTTVATLTAPGQVAEIELDNYVRINNATATGGNVGAQLIGNL